MKKVKDLEKFEIKDCQQIKGGIKYYETPTGLMLPIAHKRGKYAIYVDGLFMGYADL
jgi:hypothetical protein